MSDDPFSVTAGANVHWQPYPSGVLLGAFEVILLQVGTPTAFAAGTLWNNEANKLNKTIEGAHVEHAKKIREAKPATRDKK